MSVSKIKEYSRRLDKHSDDKTVLKETLYKLNKMEVTVDILQQTGIGKIVSSLRKKSGSAGLMATELIKKWRNVVDREADEDVSPGRTKERDEKGNENRPDKPHHKEHNGKHSSSHKSKSDRHKDQDKRINGSTKDSEHKRERQPEGKGGNPMKDNKQNDSHHKHHGSERSETSISKDRGDRKRHRSPEKQEPEGLDANFGTFEDCLGLNDPVMKKKKRKPQRTSSSPKMTVTTSTLNSPNSKPKGPRLPDLIDKKPLDARLQDIETLVTDYKPLPRIEPRAPVAPKMPHINPEQMFTSNKRDRTAVYSGRRNCTVTEVPTLFDACIRVLIEHVDYIEQTGGVPYDILKPILLRCTWEQLYNLENYNPYLVEDSDPIWETHVRKDFRGKQPKKGEETWRELYLQLHDDREKKLKSLAATISKSQKEKQAPVRTTKLAYVDSIAKAPRNVQRAQLRNGTSNSCRPDPSQARSIAYQASTASATESVRARAVAVPKKPKQAPLMMKALSLIKQRRGYGFSSR